MKPGLAHDFHHKTELDFIRWIEVIRYDSRKGQNENIHYLSLLHSYFCCILGKLGYEQIFHHTDIMEKALSLWERDFTVAGLRGSILDKNGNVLAHDIPSTSVMVVPAQIQDADKTAQQLADVLQADKKKSCLPSPSMSAPRSCSRRDV